MISKGCLQPLLILLSTQDLVVRQQSAAAVRDLASNLTYKATMAEEGFKENNRFRRLIFNYFGSAMFHI